MAKTGHQLSDLGTQFSDEVRRALAERVSVHTAEEFLGVAVTQDLVSFAGNLGVRPELLDRAIQIAKRYVDPEYLREINRPVESYPTGTRIDEPFELPEKLARHLQEG